MSCIEEALNKYLNHEHFSYIKKKKSPSLPAQWYAHSLLGDIKRLVVSPVGMVHVKFIGNSERKWLQWLVIDGLWKKWFIIQKYICGKEWRKEGDKDIWDEADSR